MSQLLRVSQLAEFMHQKHLMFLVRELKGLCLEVELLSDKPVEKVEGKYSEENKDEKSTEKRI